MRRTDMRGDEAAVREAVSRMQEAFRQLDARRFAAFFADGADFYNPMGMPLRGRPEIEAAHEKLFSPTPPPGFPSFAAAKSTSNVVNLRFLRPDVAVVDQEWSQSGATTDGKPWPDRKGMLTMVLTQENGGPWLISVWRNKDYPDLPQSRLTG